MVSFSKIWNLPIADHIVKYNINVLNRTYPTYKPISLVRSKQTF